VIPPTSDLGHENINPFRLVFPELALYSDQSRWDDLIRAAELADLKKGGREADLTRFLVVAPLALTYLILDQVAAARWVILRLPEDLAETTLSQLLFRLISSTEDRKYANIYTRANELLELISAESSDVEAELNVVLSQLIQKFIDTFRTRTFDLLRRAYTEISTSEAQQYLGIGPNVILQAAKASGQWSYEPKTQILTPIHNPSHASVGADGASNLTTFKSVSSGAIRLESRHR